MTVIWAIGDQVFEFEPKIERIDLIPTLEKVQESLIELSEKAVELEEVAEFEDILNEACAAFTWQAKDIRAQILNLIDSEATEGDDPQVLDELRSSFDTFNNFVLDNMKLEKQEQDDFEQALAGYQDDVTSAPGADPLLYNMGESISVATRKKSAAVVRTRPDGSKVHKFPIPDKAHARAALAMIHQSDLTPEEKAKVRRKAGRFLNVNPTKHATTLTQETKESGADMIDDMEAELQVLDITEATVDLAKGELEVTFLTPGFNRSGYRYYTKDAIREAVDNGMFNNLKMFMNHQTPQEMSQRPERSVTDWVSTLKETWVDSNGAAKGKVRVVQSWFSGFLKDLQESGAIGEIGLSIFAQGKVKPTRMEGRQTNVVERFQKAMSVDWVTEPGAGGRVDQMWESYQPIAHKEQELNVLASMDASEAIKTLKESRPDVLEQLAKQYKDESDAEARLQEATSAVEGLMEKVAQLEKERVEAEKVLADSKANQVKDKQLAFVVEALGKSGLPQMAKDRIKDALMVSVHSTEDGQFDQTKVEGTLKESVDAETSYINSLVKESGGKGIVGLGSTESTTKTFIEADTSVNDRILARLDLAMGNPPVEA